jgi:hypothetical protein
MKSNRIALISVTKDKRPNKTSKYKAKFRIGENKTKIVYFGGRGYRDYTMKSTPDKTRLLYIGRHKKENWTDPMSRGTLSRYILWEYKGLNKAVKEYRNRFNLKSK